MILSDNTPGKDNGSFFEEIENAVYICNGRNLGLSRGINRGVRTKAAKESDYLFFFDQDSVIPDGHIETMIADWEKLEKDHRIALLGPHYHDEITGADDSELIVADKDKIIDGVYYPVHQMITSSMLTKYDLLKQIGFWNNDIFLDFADFDLCWRFVHAGYELFITRNAELSHRLGDGYVMAHMPFSKNEFPMGYGSAFRKYYQTRALMKLRKCDYIPDEWKGLVKANLTIRTYFDLRFLPDKRRRFLYYLRGLIDGALGKNGELKTCKSKKKMILRGGGNGEQKSVQYEKIPITAVTGGSVGRMHQVSADDSL